MKGEWARRVVRRHREASGLQATTWGKEGRSGAEFVATGSGGGAILEGACQCSAERRMMGCCRDGEEKTGCCRGRGGEPVCPLRRVGIPLVVGAATFGWYALPDACPSRLGRAMTKTGLLAGAVASVAALGGLRLSDITDGIKTAKRACAEGDRTVTPAGARDFGSEDEAIGVEPEGRDVLGTLRDRKTFEAGGRCGCGSDRPKQRGEGGCCKDASDGSGPREENGCCRGGKTAREASTPDPAGGSVTLVSRKTLAFVSAGLALAVAEQSIIYRIGEALKRRGVSHAHTKQAALLGALAFVGAWGVDWRPDGEDA